MIRFDCIVQEGCIPKSIRGSLEKAMSCVTTRNHNSGSTRE